jgi:hypothetical protein
VTREALQADRAVDTRQNSLALLLDILEAFGEAISKLERAYGFDQDLDAARQRQQELRVAVLKQSAANAETVH